jgi:hypothetical protein
MEKMLCKLQGTNFSYLLTPGIGEETLWKEKSFVTMTMLHSTG